MTYDFTVSPDFTPDFIAGWYVFNTWIQRHLDEQIHLELHDDFAAQHKQIDDDKVDLIYANPYDAAKLVREKGFLAVGRPENKPDETTVVVSAESPVTQVEDLQPGTRVATTDDPDVHLMGMIILEPADLDASNVEITVHPSYVVVAKALIEGTADVGFFLDEAFNSLSAMVSQQLRPIVVGQISLIHHSLLVGPRLADRLNEIQALLLAMNDDPKGQAVTSGLGFTKWLPVDQEETELMIDLMETLNPE